MVKVQQSRAEVLAILGLTSADDDEDTIRKAYKRLALQHHPDKNQGSVESEAQFKSIVNAYSRLTTPEEEEFDEEEAMAAAFSELFSMFGRSGRRGGPMGGMPFFFSGGPGGGFGFSFSGGGGGFRGGPGRGGRGAPHGMPFPFPFYYDPGDDDDDYEEGDSDDEWEEEEEDEPQYASRGAGRGGGSSYNQQSKPSRPSTVPNDPDRLAKEFAAEAARAVAEQQQRERAAREAGQQRKNSKKKGGKNAKANDAPKHREEQADRGRDSDGDDISDAGGDTDPAQAAAADEARRAAKLAAKRARYKANKAAAAAAATVNGGDADPESGGKADDVSVKVPSGAESVAGGQSTASIPEPAVPLPIPPKAVPAPKTAKKDAAAAAAAKAAEEAALAEAAKAAKEEEMDMLRRLANIRAGSSVGGGQSRGAAQMATDGTSGAAPGKKVPAGTTAKGSGSKQHAQPQVQPQAQRQMPQASPQTAPLQQAQAKDQPNGVRRGGAPATGAGSAPAAAAHIPVSTEVWMCRVCTLDNAPAARSCAACGSPSSEAALRGGARDAMLARAHSSRSSYSPERMKNAAHAQQPPAPEPKAAAPRVASPQKRGSKPHASKVPAPRAVPPPQPAAPAVEVFRHGDSPPQVQTPVKKAPLKYKPPTASQAPVAPQTYEQPAQSAQWAPPSAPVFGSVQPQYGEQQYYAPQPTQSYSYGQYETAAQQGYYAQGYGYPAGGDPVNEWVTASQAPSPLYLASGGQNAFYGGYAQ